MPFVIWVCLFCLLIVVDTAWGQSRTVGLFLNSSVSSPGFTLVAPMASTRTYLIDNNGNLVHSWTSTLLPGDAAYLTSDGDLLRTGDVNSPIFTSGGQGGRIQKFSWNNELLWDFTHASTSVCQHHDVKPLPNGNVLFIAWERKNVQEAVEAGRNPAQVPPNGLWPEAILEVKPTGSTTGDIVWEWHVWDHLIQDYDVAKSNYGAVWEHPERIDFNFVLPIGSGADWLHTNSADYHPGLDQIIVSVHNFHEVWIIDHSTTTAEAKGKTGGRWGKGGDLLYRWGNPRAYRKGLPAQQRFFGQHDAQWVTTGKETNRFLVFSNGLRRPGGEISTVDEFVAPVDSIGAYVRDTTSKYGPDSLAWQYKGDFFSQNISGAQRLQNGNTLVCDGPRGTLREISPEGSLVWKYVNPIVAFGALRYDQMIPAAGESDQNLVFKVRRYAPDFPGFAGKTLKPLGPVEIGSPTGVESAVGCTEFALELNYPNPFNPNTVISYELPVTSSVKLAIYDLLGREVAVLVNERKPAGRYRTTWDASRQPSGVYFYRLTAGEHTQTRKMLLTK